MQQSSPTWFPYLDGWRGLALALLLIGHFFPVPGLNFGAVGVHLFFVLSGLLMAHLLFIQKVPLDLFYKRRVARIFPAAFVFLFVITVYYLLMGRDVAWMEVMQAASFINNYFLDLPGSKLMPFGHIWSLSVEEHSYILLSLIALGVRYKKIKAVFAVTFCAACMVLFALYYSHVYSGRALEFRLAHTEVAAIGIFASAGLTLYFHGRGIPKLTGMTIGALIGFGILVHWWSVPKALGGAIGMAAFALALNLMSAGPKWVHAVFSFAPLRQLGLWSFSIYLWQQPFYLHLSTHGGSRLAFLSAGVACGIISYYLVEQPARAALTRQWTTRRLLSVEPG